MKRSTDQNGRPPLFDLQSILCLGGLSCGQPSAGWGAGRPAAGQAPAECRWGSGPPPRRAGAPGPEGREVWCHSTIPAVCRGRRPIARGQGKSVVCPSFHPQRGFQKEGKKHPVNGTLQITRSVLGRSLNKCHFYSRPDAAAVCRLATDLLSSLQGFSETFWDAGKKRNLYITLPPQQCPTLVGHKILTQRVSSTGGRLSDKGTF